MTTTDQHVFPQALQAGDMAQATGGMTLRDYFAAQAMNGMQANTGANRWSDEKFAKRSFEIADAMLRARQQPITN